MAVTQGWLVTGSTSLIEAVSNGESQLGAFEVLTRLGMMVRHTRPSESRADDKPLLRVLLKGVDQKWPVQALAPWQILLERPAVFTRLAFPTLHTRILAGEKDASEVLRWVHSSLRPLSTWAPADIQAVESLDDPLVRDSYWALRRTPSARPGR